MSEHNSSQVNLYEITIQGNLDHRWSDWFTGITDTINEETLNTRLTVSITDQAQLRGILNKIWDLNLTLLSVNLIRVAAES